MTNDIRRNVVYMHWICALIKVPLFSCLIEFDSVYRVTKQVIKILDLYEIPDLSPFSPKKKKKHLFCVVCDCQPDSESRITII